MRPLCAARHAEPPTRSQPRRRWAALAAAALALTGCFTPPIVQEAGKRDLQVRGNLPADTRTVEVTTADGVTLRGLFVPAAPGAPVVLHLLPSKTSITTGIELGGMVLSIEQAPIDFAESGFASLLVDYRGVGASDGSRDPDALVEDAYAMWREAVRLAGGHPGNVVVRGQSIGALTTAGILDRGAAPRGVILIAPVRGETIGSSAARQRHGAFLGALLSLFHGGATDIAIDDTLREKPTPILLLLPEDGPFLTENEQQGLHAAADRPGNHVYYLTGDHHDVVERARRVLNPERAFLIELFGGNGASAD